jgi:hypothetical protein
MIHMLVMESLFSDLANASWPSTIIEPLHYSSVCIYIISQLRLMCQMHWNI